jgi:hypothetical protein
MKLVIGSQQSGAVIELDLASGMNDRELNALLVKAFDTLRATQTVARDHFLKHETPDEKKRRLLYERNQELETLRIEKSNQALEQMLNGPAN